MARERFLGEAERSKLPIFWVKPGTELRISPQAVLRVRGPTEGISGFVEAVFVRTLKSGQVQEGSMMQLNLEAFDVNIGGQRHRLVFESMPEGGE